MSVIYAICAVYITGSPDPYFTKWLVQAAGLVNKTYPVDCKLFCCQYIPQNQAVL